MTSEGDFTEFLSGDQDVMLISDTEGYLSTGIQEKIDAHQGKIVFIGDMGDYTIGRGLNINTVQKDRFCFLKYLEKIVKNPTQYVAVLGNRDLNKLNLWQLVQFKDGTKWWNNISGDILNIATELKNINTSQNNQNQNNQPENKNNSKKTNINWLVDDLTSFAPYWNFHLPASSSWKGWDKSNYKTLWGRYEAIFGVDPSPGTMSAGNMADGLITELGLSVDPTDTELKAAIVFTVFARLLDPKAKGWDYDGNLYNFFRTNPLVARADINNKIYLFSHGGVHSSFNQEIINYLENNYNIITGSIVNHQIKKSPQKGGANIDFSNFKYFNHTIVYGIEKIYNDLDKFFDQTNQTNQTKQLDLSQQHPVLRSIIGIVCPIGNNDVFENKKLHFQSPIMTGIFDIKNDEQEVNNKNTDQSNVFNILGHAPSGFSYSFLIGNNGQRIINCDFSNSLLKAEKSESYDNNNVVLYFNPSDGTFKLDGTINVNGLTKQPTTTIGKKVTNLDLIIDSGTNRFFNGYTNNNRLEITFTKDKNIDFNLVSTYNTKYTTQTDQVFAYHGKVDILYNSQPYKFDMFSYSDRNFNKQLILNEKIIQLKNLMNVKVHPTNIRNNLPIPVGRYNIPPGFTAVAPPPRGGGRKQKQRKTVTRRKTSRTNKRTTTNKKTTRKSKHKNNRTRKH